MRKLTWKNKEKKCNYEMKLFANICIKKLNFREMINMLMIRYSRKYIKHLKHTYPTAYEVTIYIHPSKQITNPIHSILSLEHIKVQFIFILCLKRCKRNTISTKYLLLKVFFLCTCKRTLNLICNKPRNEVRKIGKLY